MVQVIDQPTLKYVGRLSLQFHEEDPEKFRLRLEVAKERQFTAEDEMRFYHFVNSLPDQSVSFLQEDVITMFFYIYFFRQK